MTTRAPSFRGMTETYCSVAAVEVHRQVHEILSYLQEFEGMLHVVVLAQVERQHVG